MVSGAMAANSPLHVRWLEPTASMDEIKFAYRTLAKRYHPDKCNDPEAKAIFQWLKKAYHVVINQMCHENDNQRLAHADRVHEMYSLFYVGNRKGVAYFSKCMTRIRILYCLMKRLPVKTACKQL